MAIRNILLLGNPKLYEICSSVRQEEFAVLKPDISDLRDTLLAFRGRHGVGRAIAAPQIGVMKRIVFLERVSNTTDENDSGIVTPTPLINPVLTNKSETMMELWDDCMSFPNLLVHLRRHATCNITYRDLAWCEHTIHLEGDLSELLQHECDHLDGVLAVARAIDGKAFAYKEQLQAGIGFLRQQV
ncbi:MAG: peptide deformylase [Anaerolineae bacterium]|nr:peptide deformylase [Anaerolineae bacterium]